jgi:hypothetical protein
MTIIDKMLSQRLESDKAYYQSALELQLAVRIPYGCSSVEFSTKTHAFMNYIRPYLARPHTNYDALMYNISLLPDGLKVQGRELRERIKSSGAFEDNKFVIDECVALVGEYQTGKGKTAAYFDSVAYPALASHSLPSLINVTGINFTAVRADHSAGGANAMMPLAPDNSPARPVTKWCSECDDKGMHLWGRQPCFLNPYDDTRWPLSIASDAERFRKLKAARADVGKRFNLVPRDKVEPTAQEIKDFQIWTAGKGGGKGGGRGRGADGGRGRGRTAAGVLFDLNESTLVGATHDFLSGLVELGTTRAAVVPVFAEYEATLQSEGVDPVDKDALYYMPHVACVTGLDQPPMPGGSHVPYVVPYVTPLSPGDPPPTVMNDLVGGTN